MSILSEKKLKSIPLELMDIDRELHTMIRELHNNEMRKLLLSGKTKMGDTSPEDESKRYFDIFYRF